MAKEAYHIAKEAYCMAKEAYHMAKEEYHMAQYPRATFSSAVVDDTVHHVITLPTSYSLYRSAAMPRQSVAAFLGMHAAALRNSCTYDK